MRISPLYARPNQECFYCAGAGPTKAKSDFVESNNIFISSWTKHHAALALSLVCNVPALVSEMRSHGDDVVVNYSLSDPIRDRYSSERNTNAARTCVLDLLVLQ